MNEKTKKYLIITALSVICLSLVFVIGAQFKTEKAIDEPVAEQNETESKVPVINPNIGATDNEEVADIKPEIVVNPVIQTDEQSAQAVSGGTSQTIQPDAEKTDLSEEQLTDPNQTPDGVKVDTPDLEELKNKESKPPDTTAAPPATKEPQGGDKQEGKIFIPGFGWVLDEGTGQGTPADSDGDPNKMVGIMGG